MVTGLLGSVAGQPLAIAAAVWRCSRPGALRYRTKLRSRWAVILVSVYTNSVHGKDFKSCAPLTHIQVSLAGGVVALAHDVAAARRHHGVPPRRARREEERLFYQLLVERVVERHVV